MTTYPLATLAPTINSSGISSPAYNDILQSLIASMRSIFGSDIYLTPDTQDYQLLAIFALSIFDENESIIAAYNNFSPSFAQGAGLSSLVKINGLMRKSGTPSTASIVLTGVVGTVINGGVVQDANGNLWNIPNTVIPGGGSITVTAVCETVGAIAAPAGTIDVIYNVVTGWQSASNPADATVGTNMESDAALRTRQSQSTALPSITALQAILAAVENCDPSVGRVVIFENSTNATNGLGLPPHSVSLVVEGVPTSPAQTNVAQAIENTKSPGTDTYGTTSVVVSDPAGVQNTINFFILAQVQIYVSLTIHNINGAPTAQINAAVVAFINALPIGEMVYFNWVQAAAALIGTQYQELFVITAMTMGTAPSPGGTSDIAIAFNQAAACLGANVIITVA